MAGSINVGVGGVGCNAIGGKGTSIGDARVIGGGGNDAGVIGDGGNDVSDNVGVIGATEVISAMLNSALLLRDPTKNNGAGATWFTKSAPRLFVFVAALVLQH